jgi:hypothetical protein
VYEGVPGFPAGSSVDHIAIAITGATPGNSASQSVPPGTTSVSFPDVVADTYSFNIQAQAADNSSLGSAVTGTFTITGAQTVTLSIPQSASFAQS